MDKIIKDKGKYELIIKNLERRLEKVANNRKLYKKLKNLLGMIALIVVVFGLWPVSLVSLLLAGLCAYKEKDEYKHYCTLIDKLEDSNFALLDIMEEIDKGDSSASLEQTHEQEHTSQDTLDFSDYPILDVMGESDDDHKVYRK